MRRDEAREMPGTLGDPARFVEALPGVTPTASGLQSFFVRGAPPETTGYFLDGISVPALYHIGFGPSVVHPALLDRVEFFPGAAPASYGRVIGGVIEGDTVAPSREQHGEANLRLIDVSAFGESPFGDGRGNALVAGRYGYPGSVLPLFTSDVGLSYWDYQTRVSWDLTDRDRIGAFVFGSNDRLTQNEVNGNGVPYTSQLVRTEFHRGDVRYDHALGTIGTVRVAVTLGHDLAGNETTNVLDDSLRVRSEIDLRPAPNVRIRAGTDAQLDHYTLGKSPLSSADPTVVPLGLGATPRDDVVLGAHADVSWRITPRVEIVPGIRADIFTTRRIDLPPETRGIEATAIPTLSPRISARVTLTPRVASISSFGVAHQMPGLVVTAPDVTPYLQSPGVEQGLQTSVQASQGLAFVLPAGFSATSTVFLHHYAGLPDLTAPCIVPGGDASRCISQEVGARAYGLELLVRRALTERFAVWIAYTLSRSERQAHLPDEANTLTWIASEYDRTHVVTFVTAYDLGRRWRVGGRVFAYSGRPTSNSYLGEPVPPYNSVRLPGFWRLDVRLEKSWRVGAAGRISFVAEGVNVTLNKEVVDVNCSERGPGKLDACKNDALGPITIPSVGVEGAF